MTQVRSFSDPNFIDLEIAINAFYVGNPQYILVSVSITSDGSTYRAMCVEQEVYP